MLYSIPRNVCQEKLLHFYSDTQFWHWRWWREAIDFHEISPFQEILVFHPKKEHSLHNICLNFTRFLREVRKQCAENGESIHYLTSYHYVGQLNIHFEGVFRFSSLLAKHILYLEWRKYRGENRGTIKSRALVNEKGKNLPAYLNYILKHRGQKGHLPFTLGVRQPVNGFMMSASRY